MLLTCEKCQTIFRIEDSAIAPTGQHVRCSVCEHVWHVTPSFQPDDNPDDGMLKETASKLRLPGIILISVMCLSSLFFAFRGPVTALYPPLTAVYQLLGLQIEPDLSILQVVDLNAAYDTKILRIRGNLLNTASLPAHSSALQVTVTSQQGVLLAQQTLIPEDKLLDADQKTAFFIQLELEGAEQAEILVTPVSGNISF